MDDRTLEALKGSIAKWEAIASDGGVDRGAANCPLCVAFIRNTKPRCGGCPVRDKTGLSGCENTPFSEWIRLHADESEDDEAPWHADTPEQVAAAQAELDFLKSLLPTTPPGEQRGE